MVDYNFIIR